MMKKLLVCIDGSAYAESTMSCAAWLAKMLDASIEGLYVSDLRQFEWSIMTDLSGCLGIEPYQGVLAQLQQMENQKAALLEENSRLFFKDAGLEQRFHFRHTTGLVVEHLGEFEEEKDAPDMVILGKRGENADAAAGHLGTTMERVVRASKKPCLVAPLRFREVRKMVLAYDGGTSCQKALRFLIDHAAFHAIELHVVTVNEGHDDQQADALLEEAVTILKQANIPVVAEVLHGLAEETIADYVDSQGIDFLIMGAYGHSRIRYLIIGSTTTDLIRRCHVPVLLFR